MIEMRRLKNADLFSISGSNAFNESAISCKFLSVLVFKFLKFIT